MKLSIWSSYYIDLSPEDAILEIEKNGYSYTELSDEHAAILLERGDAKTVGAEFKRFADAHHVSIPQGHLYLKVALCSEKENSVEILKNWLDLFEAIGIENAVLHCDRMADQPEMGMDEIRQRNRAVLQQLVQYLEGKNITICLENLRNMIPEVEDKAPKSVEELLWYIEELGSEHLGICLDTGHLNVSKASSQAYFIEKAGKHLKALHIADNQGQTDQHLMPFGIGNVDMKEVMRTLKNIGYQNLYNFEIPGERKGPLAIRGYKLQYIRQCMEYMERNL